MTMADLTLEGSLRKSFVILARNLGRKGRKQSRERFRKLFLEKFRELEEKENQTVDQEAQAWVARQVKNMLIYFAQVPVSMLKSMFSRGKPQEVYLYLLLHSYASRKNLKEIPRAEVVEETLAKFLGITSQNVSRWLKSMEEKGWIQIIRQGKMKPNLYDLYCIGASELEGKEAIARVQIRLRRDYALSKRLSDSLHPE